jgi:hypothetical protein
VQHCLVKTMEIVSSSISLQSAAPMFPSIEKLPDVEALVLHLLPCVVRGLSLPLPSVFQEVWAAWEQVHCWM